MVQRTIPKLWIMKSKEFYKRKLPHWQPPNSRFFITYRLAGSIPASIIQELQKKYYSCQNNSSARQEYFAEIENYLESNKEGPHWLKEDVISQIVFDSLMFNDKKDYDLYGCSIMSNHVHVVLKTINNNISLDKILQNHKKFTARKANAILGRSGQFWAQESYDTLIRSDQHFMNSVKYCLENPVKAGLVKNWQDWKWSYVQPGLKKYFKK